MAGWALGVHTRTKALLTQCVHSSACSADASAKRCVRLHLFDDVTHDVEIIESDLPRVFRVLSCV